MFFFEYVTVYCIGISEYYIQNFVNIIAIFFIDNNPSTSGDQVVVRALYNVVFSGKQYICVL